MQIRETPFVQSVAEGRRRTSLLMSFVICVLAAVLLVQVAIGAVLRIATGTGEDFASFGSQLIELATDVWPIVIILAWVALYERRPVASLGFRGGRVWLRLAAGFLLGAALITLAALPAILGGQLAEGTGGPDAVQGTAALGIVLATIPIWLVQGSSEEIVFRGFLLQRHLYSWPAWVAVLGGAALFSLIHPGGGVLGKVNIALFGVLAGLLVLQQQSLWLVMGLHAGWNFVQGNVLGIAVSGEGRDYSLFRFAPTDGSTGLVSGGEFGAEAGIAATVVLLAAIGVTAVLLRRRLAAPTAPRPTPAATGEAAR